MMALLLHMDTTNVSAANSYLATDMSSSCCSIFLDANHLQLQRSQINDRAAS